MQRTINHTGRRKIEAKELQINISGQENEAPEFDVDFSLNRDKLPDNASIYIEAYQRNTLQRFNFGTVGEIRKPENRTLDQLDLSSPTLFRVRIVDETEHLGRLVASVERLKPEGDNDEDQRSSLLEAIEFKFQNISAVLYEEKLPYVDGLKLKENYQAALKVSVLDYLKRIDKTTQEQNPIEMLTDKLKRLWRRDFLPIHGAGSGRYGLTLEYYLSIPQNSSKEPDFMGIELIKHIMGEVHSDPVIPYVIG